MNYICILGRQPEIGLAELAALYPGLVTQLGEHAAFVEAKIDFARLGSSVKCAEFISIVETPNPQKAFDFCRKQLVQDILALPEGKIKLGVSIYGIDFPVHKINANMLSLKKVVRSHERSVRIVPNAEPALSSAQTYHNQLTSEMGFEIVMVFHAGKIYIGRVVDVQDIDAYTFRDRSRPRRDAFVGMLPPKLAQTLLNLALGTNTPLNMRLLDPFCGTGVVLQEAALLGCSVYGSDISEKMVRYTRDNLNWLFDTHNIHTETYYETADATTHTWQQPVDAVCCEGYLGQPLGGQNPSDTQLQKIITDCDGVMRDFLTNISSQLASDTRLCIAAPAWHLKNTIYHLPVLDDLENMGYNRIDFEYTDTGELIYHRNDQIVGRQILVLIKQ